MDKLNPVACRHLVRLGEKSHALTKWMDCDQTPWGREVVKTEYAYDQATIDALLADAMRYRWLCDGNGYFMEENYLCGHRNEKETADAVIDAAMRGNAT